jgi:hypothetical protein
MFGPIKARLLGPASNPGARSMLSTTPLRTEDSLPPAAVVYDRLDRQRVAQLRRKKSSAHKFAKRLQSASRHKVAERAVGCGRHGMDRQFVFFRKPKADRGVQFLLAAAAFVTGMPAPSASNYMPLLNQRYAIPKLDLPDATSPRLTLGGDRSDADGGKFVPSG